MVHDEGVTACTCGVASDFEPLDAVADPACPKHAVVLRNVEAPLDSIPLPWKATSPHSDRVRDAAARKASVTREDAAMSDTGCTGDTQLTYGTWRVLVNDDGEPYAVDNGTSRLGVDTDGNVERRRSSNASTYEQLDMVGRAGYNAGLQAARDALPAPLVLDRVAPSTDAEVRERVWRNKCGKSLLDQTPEELASGWETPSESNHPQPAPVCRYEHRAYLTPCPHLECKMPRESNPPQAATPATGTRVTVEGRAGIVTQADMSLKLPIRVLHPDGFESSYSLESCEYPAPLAKDEAASLPSSSPEDRMTFWEEPESPNFTPDALKELEARGFVRVNAHRRPAAHPFERGQVVEILTGKRTGARFPILDVYFAYADCERPGVSIRDDGTELFYALEEVSSVVEAMTEIADSSCPTCDEAWFESMKDSVRRETIQACAAWLDTQLEANGVFKGFVDGADMIEAMTKKDGEP